jgi:hypothetical protein
MRTWVGLSLSLVISCAGKAPPNSGVQPDAGDDAATDGSVTPTAAALSGKTIDYFGNVNLKGTDLSTDGIDPQVTNTSSTTDATYMLNVPVGSQFYVIASKTTGYRPTRNMPVKVADMPVTQDLYATSTVDVNRQYTTLGKVPTAGTAVVFADLRKTDGTPLEGIPLTGVTLLDAANQPVPGIVGPYFFGTAGDIDPALATATAYGTPPRSRVALLDVPVGTYTLAVTYAGAGGNVTNNTLITTAADGTVLALSGGVMAPVAGATDPHFAQDIYPKLQRAADGGLGCANCHTAGGPGAVLTYDDAADTVLANMRAAGGVINTTTPAMSLFVVNPLYQAPPATKAHPNSTFIDINDPNYKFFLLWITNGTKP